MNRNKLAVPSAFAVGLVAIMPIAIAADQAPTGQRVACLTQSESSAEKTYPSATKEARRCCIKRYKGYCVKWGNCPSNCVASVRG